MLIICIKYAICNDNICIYIQLEAASGRRDISTGHAAGVPGTIQSTRGIVTHSSSHGNEEGCVRYPTSEFSEVDHRDVPSSNLVRILDFLEQSSSGEGTTTTGNNNHNHHNIIIMQEAKEIVIQIERRRREKRRTRGHD